MIVVLEKLKGWKTVIINTLTALPAAVLVFLDQFQGVDITPLLPPSKAAQIVCGLSVLNIVLRIFTNTGVGQKE